MRQSTADQFLGLPQGGGVYVITCTATGQIYIGSTSKLRKRWQHHLSKLNNGKHQTHRLQEAWNKYGREAFTFAVLEMCDGDKEALTDREQHYFDTLSPFGERGFNVGRSAMFPAKGRIKPPNEIAKLSHTYIVTAPDGTPTRIVGIIKFCQENGLTVSAMLRVASGAAKHHKGWRCERDASSTPNNQPHTPIEASKGLTS